MHRTSGTILAMSRNKEKHLSPPHYFTQARGYNTRTNPLPLLHIGEEDPFPLLHTGERVFTRFLGTENLTQHLISPRAFDKTKHSQHPNTCEYHIAIQVYTITSCLKNKVPQPNQIHISHLYLTHAKNLIKYKDKKKKE